MKALKLLFFLCATSIFAQVPANDECVNAEMITVSTSAITMSPDFTEATESLDATCNTAATDNKDLWYEFTMPIDGILRISNSGALNYFSLYDSCGGAEIACGKDDSSFGGLSNGATYLLRASFQFSGVSAFSVQALTPALNDECVNRETIVISTTTFTQPNPNSSFSSESVSASCDTSNNTYLDMWYEFVMPVTGTVEVTFSNNKQAFTLYESCSGVELQCFSNIGLFQNLNQNGTYVLRVAEQSTEVGVMNFRLQAYEYAPNDECADSETILIETASSNTYQTDLRTATESLDAFCETASNINYDLWYNFTMPVTGNLKIDQLNGLDTATIYENCGGSEISCQSGLQFVSGLISGTNYLLRIASINPLNKQPRFQAFEEALNDECVNSELITVETANFSEYSIDTRGATESIDTSCETATNDNLDLWYEFVMPVNGNVQLSNLFTNQDYSVLFDSCTGTELDCLSGNGTFFNLVSGTTYKLRFGQKTTSATTRNLRIQAFEVLTNDECASAQTITVETTQTNSYSVNVAAATESIDASCNSASSNNLDVWYSFTMSVNGNMQLTNVESSQSFSIFDACGGNELQCFTNDGAFTGLLAGTDYILRISEPETQSGIINFSVQAFEVVLNDDCVNAEAITVETTQTNTVSINLASATESVDASCETSTNNNLDVWYQFTMLVNGNLQISNADNAQRFTLFDVCNGNEIDCISGSGLFLDLTVNTNYVLRIAENDDTAGLISFDIQALEKAINDECDAAETLFVEVAQATNYSVNIASATESMDATCDSASSTNLDVWYTIIPIINGNLVITGAQNGDGFSLFNACDSGTYRMMNTELGCFNGNGSFDNLVANTTYILRIKKNVLFSTPVDFDIQVITTLGVEENELKSLSIYPNPTSNSITISNINQLQLKNASIYDLSGRKIKHVNLLSAINETIIDISELQNAMYLLVISTEKGEITKRIIKE